MIARGIFSDPSAFMQTYAAIWSFTDISRVPLSVFLSSYCVTQEFFGRSL